MQQHIPRALRPRTVAGLGTSAADERAISTCHADEYPRLFENVGDEPRGRGLAVDAGDGDDRYAERRRAEGGGRKAADRWKRSPDSFLRLPPSVFRPVDDAFDDRRPHVSWRARGRFEVHAQTGAGVDFDDCGI